MKTFQEWLKEQKYTLPVITDSEQPEGEKAEEARARTGVGPQYPDAYYQGQYPHHYHNPRKATADLDLDNAEKKKDVPG